MISIVPPFNLETAKAKVQAAEDAWNSRDPERVALAYSEDSQWRIPIITSPFDSNMSGEMLILANGFEHMEMNIGNLIKTA